MVNRDEHEYDPVAESALDIMLDRDPDVIIFGEDVGYFGGVFRTTDGLQKKHGDQGYSIRLCQKVESPLPRLAWG